MIHYKIYADNFLMLDTKLELPITNVKYGKKLNSAGKLTFLVFPNHEFIDQLVPLKTVIALKKNNNTIFKGRVLKPKTNLDKSVSFECEGCQAYLNDSVIEPYEHDGTVAALFTKYIDDHNAFVNEGQRFVVGNVTVTDPNSRIIRANSNYESAWKNINEKLLNTLGGYINIRYEIDGTYIDYLEEMPYTADQVIEYGTNLISFLDEKDYSNTYTAVLPLGATVDDERVTIESVNSGSKVLVDSEKAAIYGKILAPVSETTWDDVTLPSNLLTKAEAYLATKALALKSVVTLSALDLAYINSEVGSFELGYHIRVKVPNSESEVVYLLNEISIDLLNPSKDEFKLGATNTTVIDSINKERLSTENIIREVESNNQKELSTLWNETYSLIATTSQNAANISSNLIKITEETNGLDEKITQVSTEANQTAEDFTFQFQQLNALVTNLDGETKTQFKEILKYIRFVDGNIELGEVGNPIILVLENDILYFKQNDVKVAYLSDSKLYVTSGKFLHSLQAGNFGFIPRSNGNLSFGKLGDD